MLSKNDIIFLRKSYEVVSCWLTKNLWKFYDERRKNLTKILRSFEYRAPGLGDGRALYGQNLSTLNITL